MSSENNDSDRKHMYSVAWHKKGEENRWLCYVYLSGRRIIYRIMTFKRSMRFKLNHWLSISQFLSHKTIIFSHSTTPAHSFGTSHSVINHMSPYKWMPRQTRIFPTSPSPTLFCTWQLYPRNTNSSPDSRRFRIPLVSPCLKIGVTISFLDGGTEFRPMEEGVDMSAVAAHMQELVPGVENLRWD